MRQQIVAAGDVMQRRHVVADGVAQEVERRIVVEPGQQELSRTLGGAVRMQEIAYRLLTQRGQRGAVPGVWRARGDIAQVRGDVAGVQAVQAESSILR